MPLYQMLMVVLASSGALMMGLHLAFNSSAMQGRRIRPEAERKLRGTKFLRVCAQSMLLSLVLVFGLTLGLAPTLFYTALPSLGTGALEFVLVLLLYDFLYYWTHRYLFHVWKPLKAVHAVHHTARYPTALDSLYLHPAENVIGILLLFVSLFAVGPVSVYSFVAIFFVYSHLNILVHCGMNLPGALLRPLNYLHNKHDLHHVSMKGGNYATITPLYDILFRTAE